jgi:RNA polymerase sigma factor (sigma-70 family)
VTLETSFQLRWKPEQLFLWVRPITWNYEMNEVEGLRRPPQSLRRRRLVGPSVGTSDEALLAGLAAGDREAATEFVRRFQRRVYGLALTIVGDSGTAEDVAQETFVRAWRHGATYDPRRGRVLTWLLAITRNLAIDVVRPRRADPLDPEVLMAKLERDESRVAPEEQSQLAERERLRQALDRLPVEQRRAVLLAAIFGRSAREIGVLEAVPLGTAKTRIRTGMIRLHEMLEVGDER